MATSMVDAELVQLVRFTIPGKPQNWSNRSKGKHWAEIYRERRDWKERTIMLALQARGRARVPQPSGLRQVEIVLHTARLFDRDGAYAAIKPVLDGLKGFLIVDDRDQFCELSVRQEKVKHYPEQHIEVIIRERRRAA